jgi:hypothetical protein
MPPRTTFPHAHLPVGGDPSLHAGARFNKPHDHQPEDTTRPGFYAACVAR